MSKWAARRTEIQQAQFSETPHREALTKPPKAPFVSFGSAPIESIPENALPAAGIQAATIADRPPPANEPLPDKRTEARRIKVANMLKQNPGIRYATLIEDGGADPVAMAVAVRDIGTCELLIPGDRYNPLEMLAVMGELEQLGLHKLEAMQ